jgi:hypothetical protein
MKIAVFWVVAPCSLVDNPEDSNLHTHRRENLKSYQDTEFHYKITCIDLFY